MRLRELKLYLGLLVQENVIDEDLNLSGSEWDMLEDIEEILEPFMLIQRILEGQKCVTISFVPYLITFLRNKLEEKSVNARSHAVRKLAHNMLTHKVKGLNTYWGTGEENTLFDENEAVGRGNRQKDFPRNTIVAAALDPRSKSLKGIGADDKKKIWGEIIRLMHKVVEEQNNGVDDDINFDDSTVVRNEIQQPMANLFNRIGDDDDMVAESANTADQRIFTELEYYKKFERTQCYAA